MPRLAAALVLLCLWFGPARAQAPDTVWLEELTWTELRDLVRSGTTTIIIPVGGVEQSGPGLAHGFRTVIFIGEHGSYQGDLAAAALQLNRDWPGTPARAFFVPEYYRAATTDFYPVLKSHGYSAAEIGTHAGVADTSLTMAVDPRAVRAEALKTGTDLDAANGVYGDPRRSSADMGRLAADAIVDRTVAAIRADMARNRP